MTNYREILRLDSLGLNKTQIADACDCSRTTVIRNNPRKKKNHHHRNTGLPVEQSIMQGGKTNVNRKYSY